MIDIKIKLQRVSKITTCLALSHASCASARAFCALAKSADESLANSAFASAVAVSASRLAFVQLPQSPNSNSNKPE